MLDTVQAGTTAAGSATFPSALVGCEAKEGSELQVGALLHPA